MTSERDTLKGEKTLLTSEKATLETQNEDLTSEKKGVISYLKQYLSKLSYFYQAPWTQLGSDIDGDAAGDESGYSVSLSCDGNRVAIGATKVDTKAGTKSGRVKVYEWDDSIETWTQLGLDINGKNALDYSGTSVSLSSDGKRVAIGAPYNDENGMNSGHVRVYEYNDSSWTQLGSDINGEAVWDILGNLVSLSSDGNRVAIGAPFNDENVQNSGHVRVYEWGDSIETWTQLGSDIDGDAAGDESGYSVSLSCDGNRVAIGAPLNDRNRTNSGHVRVYYWNDSSWAQVGLNIDGEAEFDKFGCSVSLSSDGKRVAIGAEFNDGNGTDSGHVRVYYQNDEYSEYFN